MLILNNVRGEHSPPHITKKACLSVGPYIALFYSSGAERLCLRGLRLVRYDLVLHI